MNAAALCVLMAVLEGCALEGPAILMDEYTTNASLRKRCRGFECYFLPISACNQNGQSQRKVRTLNDTDEALLTSRDRASSMLRKVAERTGLTSQFLAKATVMAYLLRPKPLLAEAVDTFLAEAGMAGANGTPRPRCVGEHLRRGEKLSYHLIQSARGYEPAKLALNESSFWRWGVQVARNYGASRVLYMTDDGDTASRLTGLGGRTEIPFVLVPRPLSCFASALPSGRGTGASERLQVLQKDLGQGRATAKTIRHTRDYSKKTRQQTQKRLRDVESGLVTACEPRFADEGLLVAAGLLMLSHCSAFVGTLNNCWLEMAHTTCARTLGPVRSEAPLPAPFVGHCRNAQTLICSFASSGTRTLGRLHLS